MIPSMLAKLPDRENRIKQSMAAHGVGVSVSRVIQSPLFLSPE